MLANAGFLLVAVGVAVLASLLLWLRHHKPSSLSSSVDEFQREMDALGRPPAERRSDRRWLSRRTRSSTSSARQGRHVWRHEGGTARSRSDGVSRVERPDPEER